MKKIIPAMAVVLFALGCSGVKKAVVKDVPLEDQRALTREYVGRSAWTRGVLHDVGKAGSIPGDTKVKITAIGMVYDGTVTVRTLRRKNKVVQALGLAPPLSAKKIRARLTELFWFDDPVLRQVSYIRRWGKKMARAIMAHEVYIGMTAEAAIESWGYPGKKNINEVGNDKLEQWIYPAGNGKKKYIYVRDGKVYKWDE